jgi:hypothetical protein
MSNFVEIGTSVADIISIANRLRVRGEDLAGAVSDASSDIEAQEGRQETFPRDKFTDQFLPHYHASTEYGVGDEVRSGPTNEAIRATAVEMGHKLTEVGDWVGQAMFTYSAQNEGNASDIASSPNG